MPRWAYSLHGVIVRNPRGAEPADHPESAGVVRVLGQRARAPAAAVPDLRVQAPARAARGRLRRGARRSPAARLSTPARAAHGGGRLAGALPALLDGPRRCARAA